MLKKRHLVVIVLFFAMNIIPLTTFSQEYKGSVGGRFGYGIALTGVYFFDTDNGQDIEFYWVMVITD